MEVGNSGWSDREGGRDIFVAGKDCGGLTSDILSSCSSMINHHFKRASFLQDIGSTATRLIGGQKVMLN